MQEARIERGVVRLDVRDRGGALTFLAPFDRPVPIAGARRARAVRRQRLAARLAGLRAERHDWRTPSAAVDAAFDVHAYQFEPTLAVLAGARRVLLADAVGLGKTVQAGLLMAELCRRLGRLRALVLCPATLRDQWIEELAQRFALRGRPADAATIAAAGRSTPIGDTPWRTGIWIGSVDFIKQPYVLDGIPLTPWDLLVIDEAHEVTGRSDRHQACDELARRARRVLLLTATPHDGDEDRFGRLLDLGALRRADDVPVVLRRTPADVGLDRQRHVRWCRVRPGPDEARLWAALAAHAEAIAGLAPARRSEAAALLVAVFRKRALSGVAALRRSLERRRQWLMGPRVAFAQDWLQPRLTFDDEDDVPDRERAALTADIGVTPAEERRWLRRLLRLAEAVRADSKLERVAALAARTREPMVVFTEFRDSLHALATRLAGLRAIACLHGGQPLSVRRMELARFRTGEASVLISTDVGGQGLNLQDRARWVVGLELPWTPARIEQRIGRVDRIGQRRTVHATLLVTHDRVEDRVLVALARRVLAARRALGTGTLRDLAPPGEAAVERLLGDHRALPLGARTADVPVSRRWQRPARAVARVVAARRTLARRWRAPSPGGRTLTWTRRGTPVRAIAVASVPLVDARGVEVERHLLAMTMPPSLARGSTRELQAATHRLASIRLAARCRRVTRLLRMAAAAEAATEAALIDDLQSTHDPVEAQPGLFGQAELRAFERMRKDVERLTEDAVVPDARLAADVRVGSPMIDCVAVL